MDFQNARLHEGDQAAQVPDDKGLFGFLSAREPDGFDSVGKPGEGVFLEEALFAGPVRAADQRKRASYDVGENIIGDARAVFGKAELGEPLAFPENPIGMGQGHTRDFDRTSFFRSHRASLLLPGFPGKSASACPASRRLAMLHFELHLRGGLVLAQALERGLPEPHVLRPSAKLDFANQFRLDEHSAPALGRAQRIAEG